MAPITDFFSGLFSCAERTA